MTQLVRRLACFVINGCGRVLRDKQYLDRQVTRLGCLLACYVFVIVWQYFEQPEVPV
jgi:hypothetical protein